MKTIKPLQVNGLSLSIMKTILWNITQALIGAAIWGGPFIYYFVWGMKP